MSGAWLSSDRPPLQTGMYLLEAGTVAPAQRSTAFQYEIISTLLQSLWIIGLWVLLTALRVPRRATALALAACLFSGFVVLNTFYVWPKLVTAAYVLPVVAVALVGLQSPPRRQVFMGVLMGTAATLGMLLHTGTAFALIAITLSVVAMRRRVPLRFAAVLVAFLVAGQGSWMMYQRFLDPPGDKLQQLQLAGVTDRDPSGLAHAISHAYGALGVQGVLRQKIDNAQYVIGLPVNDAGALGTLLTARATGAPQISTRAEAADRIRVDTFFYMSEAGGIVSLAGVVAAAGLLSSRVRLRRESRIAGSLLLVVLFGLVAWCLIMFGPPEAASVVHQGTYVLPLLLITGAVIMLWSIARRFAVCLVAMHVLLTLALYWWLVPSHFAEPEPRNVAMQVASLGGVLVTVAILVRFGAGRGRVGSGVAAA